MCSNAKLISVIVPFYNLSNYLEEALNSIEDQTYDTFECIIVDDGSDPAESRAAIDIVSSKDSRFSIFIKSNEGVASALNYGFSKSKGDYILVLSADDFIHPDYLIKTYNAITTKGVDIIGVNTLSFGDSNTLYITANELKIDAILKGNNIHYCCLMKRVVWDTVGGFTPNIPYEDWDFWIRAAKNNFKLHRIDEILFYYRDRANSIDNEAKKNYEYNKEKMLARHKLL